MEPLTKLANQFEEQLELQPDPPSSHPPISIEHNRDLAGSLKEDLQKGSASLASISLEGVQKNLAAFIARNLAKKGYTISPEDVYKNLLHFGEYSRAEQDLISDFAQSLMIYSNKAVHYIINNLSR